MLPLDCCSRRSPESCDLCVLLTKHAVEKDASDEDIIFRGHFMERTRAFGAKNRKVAFRRMQPFFEPKPITKSDLYKKAIRHYRCEKPSCGSRIFSYETAVSFPVVVGPSIVMVFFLKPACPRDLSVVILQLLVLVG